MTPGDEDHATEEFYLQSRAVSYGSRLPDNAPPILIRNTVDLDQSHLAWPQVISNRRRVPITLLKRFCFQILSGCQDSRCRNSICLTYRKRSSREPLRSFTNLSATALAIELASQEHPEKHLCPPYLHPEKGFEGDRSRRQKRPGSAKTKEVSRTKPTPSTDSSVEIVELRETPKSTSNSQDPIRQSNDHPVKPVKPKDPKSFVQALYDTKALKEFQAATGNNTGLDILQYTSCQESSTSQAESTSGKGSEQTEYGGRKIDKMIEQGKQQAPMSHHPVPTCALWGGQIGHEPSSRHSTDLNEQRAQTLSHFSVDNVKTLMWWAQGLKKRCSKECRYEDVHGWGTTGSTSEEDLLVASYKCKSIVAFARQSMVYILSSSRALSLSFRYSVNQSDKGGKSHTVSVPFDSMVQSFNWLRKLEGYSPIILQSLSSASEALYALMPPRKGSKARYRTRSATTLRALIDHDLSAPFHHIKDEREAAHLAHIMLSALVATIPRCSAQAWWLVSDCHRKGIMAHDQMTDPATTESLQLVLDSFEDSTALHLLEKLCKALSTRMSVAGVTKRAKSAEEAPPPVHEKEKSVLGWVLDGLLDTEPLLLESFRTPKNSNVEGVHVGYGHCPPGKQRVSSPTYLSLIIEWLKVLVVKKWDGKPEIDIFSTAGSALEVLRYFHQNTPYGDSSSLFQLPLLAAQLDFLNMPANHLSFPRQTNIRHLLQYPFVLGLKGQVSCFRAMNYTRMFKAYEDTVVATRLLAQMSFPDAMSGRGEIRFEERLANVLKSYFVIDIRRQSVLVDALDQVWRREKRELMRPLKVRMGMDEGEEGVDHGGVQQEFFRIAIAEAFNPDYGLFTVIDEHTQMAWLRPCSREPLYKFEMIGLLFSLAIYNGLTLPVNLPLAFYRKLQGHRSTELEDIEDGWPALTKGLRSLLEWSEGDVADVFARTYDFVVEAPGQSIVVHMQRAQQDDDSREAEELDTHTKERNFHGEIGSPTPIFQTEDQHGSTCWSPSSESGPSREAGKEYTTTVSPDDATSKPSNTPPVMVTNANREQYVKDYIFWLTEKSIEAQFHAFARAFFTCISPEAPRILEGKDFKRLVEGRQEVQVQELRRISQYDGGYTAEHPTIQDFWRTVQCFSPRQVTTLLEFITASDRLPVTGVDGVSISIQKNGEGDDRLPTSLTCYGKLLLPAYSSQGVLEEKLCLAIENSKGFGVP
ncbi:MAG: hypothetical protein Q9182_002238 [Xanthomendoza sp. 2 TL-2023]